MRNGLAYLAKQQKADGSFDASENKVAVTGLSVMAFLAAGHTPDVGRYGLVVRGGIDYLLAQANAEGYFGKSHSKGMYDQGIVTLALAEAIGVETDEARRLKIRAGLTKAVKVILDAQAVAKPDPHQGGWRYEPKSPDSDLSLSGWNALALRAAQDVGVDVPKEAVQKAVGYVLRCYNGGDKGFSYQPGGGAQVGPTGIGVLTLYLLDGSQRPEVAEGAKWLAAHPVGDEPRSATIQSTTLPRPPTTPAVRHGPPSRGRCSSGWWHSRARMGLGRRAPRSRKGPIRRRWRC